MCDDCRAARSEYNRAYRAANRKNIAKYNRAYYEANRERIAEKQRAHRKANRDEIAERNRAYREANPEKFAERRLVAKFGITGAEYDQLVMAQCGTCGICGEPESTGKKLAVDHNHDTGGMRGLLCGLCNRGLGSLRDSPELLDRAVAYLGGE